MNKDILMGQWKQLRGEVRHWWGELTDDDVDRAAGSADQLAGILQERYGYTREEADNAISDFLEAMEERFEWQS
jgi:uncharacterized protein YjbJ (UPF0337 family)